MPPLALWVMAKETKKRLSNQAFWRRYDKIFDAACRSDDPDERLRLLAKAEKLINDDPARLIEPIVGGPDERIRRKPTPP